MFELRVDNVDQRAYDLTAVRAAIDDWITARVAGRASERPVASHLDQPDGRR
ncbi:hypothetical protein [Actinomadura sp. DC4]|uniref:hypothetical protein n=1 Tax=Actinomadura sp. DC4 TaxID=3055069 RepID=UPI0025B19E20|nr:hypothetical protein [Actinomadura sp. DC4]MDN3358479.1 hypothetical protein [Actinomadura sp. DC4]